MDAVANHSHLCYFAVYAGDDMSASGTQPARPAGKETQPAGNVTRREITSEELFVGGQEIHIRHAREIYTLRKTSKGKLILTK